MNAVLNAMANMILFGIISYFFYYEESTKKVLRVFEAEALFAAFVICEGFGVFLIDAIFNGFHIMPENISVQKSIETMFSKLVLVFLYYIVVSRIWKKSLLGSKKQYGLYLVMFAYSMINFLIVAIIAMDEKPIILTVIMGCTLFANMYFLHFIKYSDERNYYKMQLEMMEQQERIQYENNMIQSEKYNEAVSILHDVDKHMKMIENLYQEDLKREALNYTNQIRQMLQPLVPFRYTDNHVLNCLLSDKKRVADRNDITFKIETDDVNIDFMKPIDITILFGNLIDNAIEASKACNKKRYIGLFIKEHNEMLSVRIENYIEKPVLIKNGIIDDTNDKRKGVGILNIQRCIEFYLGSIIYKSSDQMLVCDIILNRLDE